MEMEMRRVGVGVEEVYFPEPPWWQMFTISSSRERWCGAIICLFVTSFLVVLLCAVIQSTNGKICPKKLVKVPLCETAACLAAADHILKFVNTSADPCDDFHNFVCGNFHKNYKFHNYKSPLTARNEQVNNKFESWLTDETVPLNEHLPQNLMNARTFYKVCMDLQKVDSERDEEYWDQLDIVTGKWPLVRENITVNWTAIMGRARDLGFAFNFILKVEPAFQRGYALKVGPPTLPLWLANMHDANTVKIFERFAFNSQRANTSIDYESNELYKFLQQFKQLVMSQEPYQTVKQISELKQSSMFKGNWHFFLQNISGVYLNHSDYIIYEFKDDSYFEKLYHLTEKFGTRFMHNYIILSTIVEDCQYLSRYCRSVCADTVPNWIKNRKLFCRKELQTFFGREMEMLYTRQVITNQTRKDGKKLIEQIQYGMQCSLQNNEFLSFETKIAAVNFLERTSKFVGYTNISFDEIWYRQIYEGTRSELRSNTSVEIYHQLVVEHTDFYFYMEHFPTGSYEAIPIPKFEAAVTFGLPENVIYALSPVLFEPMFASNRMQYLNFGSLGTLIGSAFIHAFLNETYIESLPPDSDWVAEIWKMIHKKQEPCIVNAYKNFIENQPDIVKVTEKVAKELLAHFGGVNVAYHAYQQWVAAHGEEKFLPGLPYTPNQLFWIMSSTHLCEDLDIVNSLSEKNRKLYFSEHPLHIFSNVGSKINSNHFAKDFECSSQSKMYSEEKCVTFT